MEPTEKAGGTGEVRSVSAALGFEGGYPTGPNRTFTGYASASGVRRSRSRMGSITRYSYIWAEAQSSATRPEMHVQANRSEINGSQHRPVSVTYKVPLLS